MVSSRLETAQVADTRIQILGPLCVWRAGEPVGMGPAGQRAVLALLAMAGDQPLPRAELIDTLWGSRPPSTATNVIQTHVKHLRRLLEPDRRPYARSAVIPKVGDGYALRVPADDIDLHRFRRLLAAARTMERADELRRAVAVLRDALQLWRGAPLADLPFLAAHPKVVALANERLLAHARYGDLMLALGSPAEALPILEEVAAAQPLDENAQARLIRAYRAVGRRAQAFDAYHRTRQRLVDELGVDPGPELTAAHLSLLRDDPPLPSPDPPPTRVTSPPTAGAQAHRAPVPTQLPADVHAFTGRTAELAALDELLPGDGTDTRDTRPPTAVAIAVVCGTAGVGKTALAVHWAHRARHRFTDGQLYVDLRGYDPDQPAQPRDVLARLLGSLGVPDQQVPLDIDALAARYRTELTGRRTLVLLDNAASVDQVRPLLPGTSSCMVVVTSRDSLPGLVARHGARRVDCNLLPLADAMVLIGTLIGKRVAAEPDHAAALTRQCAHLPLALRVAAELATARPGTSLADLVSELADQQRRLYLLDAGGDPRAAVRAVFSWSYRHLPNDAARAFRRLGLHPGPDVGPGAAAALIGATVPLTRRLLDVLARAHLIQPTGDGRYGMHDLLRAYATHLGQAHDAVSVRQSCLTDLFDHYLASAATAAHTLYPAEGNHRPPPAALRTATVPPALNDIGAARAWLAAERPTLVAVCGHAANHGWARHAIGLATTLFRYLDGGHYSDALAIHHHALSAAAHLGDQSAMADSMTNLGAVYWRLGRYSLAETHHQRALEQHRSVTDRAGEARTLANLGNVYWRQGRYADAETHHQQALALFRSLDHRLGEARTLSNLGNVYWRQGRYADAETHHQQALALFRSLDHRLGEASSLTNLGNVYRRQGRYVDAETHHRQSLGLFRELGHPLGEAHALTALGDDETRLGRYDFALRHHTEALALFRRTGERYGEAAALNGSGETLWAVGRATDARTRHATALAIAVQSGDQDEEARARAGLATVDAAELRP